MKVSQLIEALKQFPQDAEIITHSDNYYTRREDIIRVGAYKDTYAGGEFVYIGNWNESTLKHSKYREFCDYSFVVNPNPYGLPTNGLTPGELIKVKHVFVPERTYEVVTRHKQDATVEFQVVE